MNSNNLSNGLLNSANIYQDQQDAMSVLHDGLSVAGYKPQSQSAVDLVNVNKRLEEQLLRHLDSFAGDIDKRWLAIGRTHVEQAFMAINRAVFKPDRVTLPDDPPKA